MDMAKKKNENENFDKRWVVHNFNKMFKRWVIHNLLKFFNANDDIGDYVDASDG